MLFGLSGASRSGKSTVMRAVAEKAGIAYFATSTAKVVEKLGIELTRPMDLRERLILQLAILENHVEETMSLDRPTIVDRTPLDMVAYLFSEFGMASHELMDENQIAKTMRYMEICHEHTVNNFDMIFTLRPLPLVAYKEEAFKPSANPAYHAHYQMVLEGNLSLLHGMVDYACITSSDHEERVDMISAIIAQRLIGMGHEAVGAALQ